MKILLVNKYWRAVGGVENHAFAVKEWLQSRGHDVIPFAMAEDDAIATDDDDTFPATVEFRMGGITQSIKAIERATLSSGTRSGLRELIARTKPDVAYVLHVYHQLGTVILNDLHAAGIPTVLSIHDYKVACPNYRLYSERSGEICTRCLVSKNAYLYAPTLERCWNGSATAGMALTVEALFTRFRGSYKSPGAVTILNGIQRRAALVAGIAEDRLIAVPHPVTLDGARSPRAGLPFLYLGRLVPEKGVDVLIRAAAQAKVKLLIAGEGRSRGELESLAVSVGGDITFLGALDRAEANKTLRGAAALVVPSVWHEVSPLVVYEAISNDVPVVASAVGGMVDQIDASRGYLVPPGDVNSLLAALLDVASDPLGAQRRSANARLYAQSHWNERAWERNMLAAFAKVGVML